MADLTITCVVNDVAPPGGRLQVEHGLALWLSTPEGEVLFDTGQSGRVLGHNLDVLGLDVAALDAVVVSHGHDDHTGGLPWLMARVGGARSETGPNTGAGSNEARSETGPNTGAGLNGARSETGLNIGAGLDEIPQGRRLPLYGNAALLEARYKVRGDGVDFRGAPVARAELGAVFDLRLDDAPQAVVPGLWTTGVITARPHPMGTGRGHRVREGEAYVADPYRDDLSLVLTSAEGLVVVCGCCHAGLLNTLEHVRRTFEGPIVDILGGTHLLNLEDAALAEIAGVLRDWGTVRHLYLNHCSGERAYAVLREALGPVVQTFPAGAIAHFKGGS